ncbi:MAG: PHP domain-containing protein [Patescibacteria group bacterium]|nr:PHP domain-containing protein [Patescibacteria group bacterium]
MTNHKIAQILRNVASAYTIKNQTKFRFQIIAYQRAADAIENSTAEIKDLTKEGKLETLPGVGPSIKSHLEELIKTGGVKHFNWVFKDIPKSFFFLLEIPGFGPKTAYKLVKEFNLKNPDTVISDLKKIAEQGKIAALEGFGDKSQAEIVTAIKDYESGKGKTSRMTLPYAYELAQKLVDYLKKSKDAIEVYPLGSLRRMVSTIGDIDIAVSTKNPKEIIKHFVSYPYKERILEQGEATASILLSSGRQVDLMTQTPESFGSLLQHFTGSKNHNVHLREFALKKNFSLSEHGIKRKAKGGWKTEEIATEEKFYNILGLKWIPPEIREDTGEIEASHRNKLPTLIELNDVKGDLHIHSNFPIEPSHDLGNNSMEEMIKKAVELRYDYIGFSEHNPSVSKHTDDQIRSILERRKEKIEQIKSSNKNIRVINLLEVDILSNGNLSISDNVLDSFDGILVSIHSAFNTNKQTMTKRILSGLSHPKAKILAHPTGRLLGNRFGYELDFEKIFDFCKTKNKALEINCWPTRLDLPDIIVREAVKNGVKMFINTDSHAAWQMDLMRYGVAVARRGWAEKKDILNTLSYDDLFRWFSK